MKGQIISYDILFASAIAVVLLGAVLAASGVVGNAAEAGYGQGALAADAALSQLVLTPGSPSDWSDEGAHSFGLVERRGVLDSGKVEQFLMLELEEGNREVLRERLGLLREGAAYEFRFEVLEPDGSKLYASSKEAAGEAYVSRRVVKLDEGTVIAVLTVWRV